jgi:hypothetical protein
VGPNQSKVVAILYAFDTDWNTACNLKLIKRPAITRGPNYSHAVDENLIDRDFPPTASSIMPGFLHDSAIQWRRPFEFFQRPKLFPNTMHSSEISEGMLKVEWLLSAIASVIDLDA